MTDSSVRSGSLGRGFSGDFGSRWSVIMKRRRVMSRRRLKNEVMTHVWVCEIIKKKD